jgi:predicted CXXCH cytochrome family protein
MPKIRWTLIVLAGLGLAGLASAGSYRDSAHGDAFDGVNRSAMDARLVDYSTGNCAHCHIMHEPGSGPAPHALFTGNFNQQRTHNPYMESDNLCFVCHNSQVGQRVVNQDYSATFGGATSGSGPQSIMDAFNLESYHNLNDIRNLLLGNQAYAWFGATSNPCSACHNPHLARRNWDGGKPGFPLLSAISRPDDHGNLWGETELMSAYIYEAPYAFGTGREPAGVGHADGDKTPDYAAFCTSCHHPQNSIWSTTLNRQVRPINWRATGENRDKHGARPRDSQHPDSGWGQRFLEPYHTAMPFKNNLVLSCLDCHEAHGSENIMLLRRRVNGGDLLDAITSAAPKSLLPLCIRCHERGYVNQLHHAPGYLVPDNDCMACHPHGGTAPETVSCGQCHQHGHNL